MVTIYSTCPSSNGVTAETFRRQIVDVARWTEAAGLRGLLVYTDNTLVDPWSAAQLMISQTDTVVPMVAVQPVYMHPFSVARMISTIAFLHGRQVDLNLVTGGFSGHLKALGCELDHDQRYDRLVEYATMIDRLLTETRPVTTAGAHFTLQTATVSPSLDPELRPRMFVSGSSPASMKAQRTLRLTRLSYPQTPQYYAKDASALNGNGIRLGIIARESNEQAWQVANERFPPDRMGERLQLLAAGQVESHWHQQLSATAADQPGADSTYWIYPFRAYKTFCPYLVGSYAAVAKTLSFYLAAGLTTIILDVPTAEYDLHSSRLVIDLACQRLAVDPKARHARLPRPTLSRRP